MTDRRAHLKKQGTPTMGGLIILTSIMHHVLVLY
ncbi:MAG: hypothetical protein ACLTR6_10645 [Clostridium fessum]